MGESTETEREKQVLLKLSPAQRQIYKRIKRLEAYKGSGLFTVLWNLLFFLGILPLVYLEKIYFPRFYEAFHPFDESLIIATFAFFHVVFLNLLTKNLRSKLNQKGIHFVHFIFLLLCFFYMVGVIILRWTSKI